MLIPTMLNRSPEITRRKQAPWNRLPVERLSGLAADDAVGRAGVLDGQGIVVVAVVRSEASQQEKKKEKKPLINRNNDKGAG